MRQTTLLDTTGEIAHHGMAFGVGVADMANQDRDTCDDLKQTLFTDSAVAGEFLDIPWDWLCLGPVPPKRLMAQGG
jgi:26S proteasome regulatory subunit N2